MLTTIPIKLDKIDYVIHIADIHIRLLNRHTEYREIFNKLYEDIKTAPKNTVIVVAGDIVHSKTNLTPELVNITSDFLYNLSKLKPTILIAGNHDVNLKNKSRLDSLSPIINNIKRNQNDFEENNLIYLKDNGLYKIANCLFSVFSVFNKPTEYNILEDVDPLLFLGIEHKIALYHGVVNGAKTDTGHVLENSNVNKHSFRNFDIAMLGDIHLANQSMNDSGTIKYCGSLITQNHGETNDKGYLFWDLNTKQSKHIEIPNDYGFYTINVNNNEILTDLTLISNKPYLRIISKGTSKLEIAKLVEQLKSKYDIQELVINSDIKDAIKKNKTSEFNVANFYNEKYRLDILKEYINEEYPNASVDLTILEQINSDMSSIIQQKDTISHNWTPLSFDFSNMFSFGENNHISFDKISGVFGLFGKNYNGKSSVIESLIYCIFDKCPKTNRSLHVLNSNQDDFSCVFSFELNNEIYTIEKYGKRNKTSVKVDIDFSKKTIDGNVISLNGEQRSDTNNNIRKYLGTYDDFILTTISSQSHTPEFADKTQGERKTILSSFLNLEIFETLYDNVNAEYKESKNKIKFYGINDILVKFENDKKAEIETTTTFKSAEGEKIKLEKELSKLELELSNLNSKIKNVNIPISIDDLEKKKKELLNNVSAFQEKIKENEQLAIVVKNRIINENKNIFSTETHIASYEEKGLSIDTELDKCKLSVNEFDTEYLKTITNEINDIDIKINSIKKELLILTANIQSMETAVKSIATIEYDKDCKYCITNINLFTGNALKAKDDLPLTIVEKDKKTIDYNKLTKEHDDLKKKLYTITKEYEVLLTDVKNKEAEKYSNQLMIDKTNSTLDSIKNNIVSFENILNSHSNATIQYKTLIDNDNESIKILDEKILEVKELENVLLENKIIQGQILELTSTKGIVQKQLNDLYKLIGSIESKLMTLSLDINIATLKINEYEKLEAYDRVLKIYVDAVHKDGLPLKIIKDVLPVIEESINNSLSYVSDFNIGLELIDNNINGYIIRNEKYPFELASGFERTIISMLFRVAMTEISNLSKAAFMVYDEGFGTMDAENIIKLNQLFELLKLKFDFIIIITHIDIIKDFVDEYYEVEKIDGYSSIQI